VPTYRLKPADIRTILGYTRRRPGYRVDLSLDQRVWGAPAFVRDLCGDGSPAGLLDEAAPIGSDRHPGVARRRCPRELITGGRAWQSLDGR